MTYKDLLFKVVSSGDTSTSEALRAVVELHKPCLGLAHDESPELADSPCICMACEDEAYPCPTIRAIEQVL